MIDAPGPWGTGPFTLVEGHSLVDTDQAVVYPEPFAATWIWREERTPRVRLVANPRYWDRERGPHLEQVVFRNDLSPKQALDLVCTTDGEVDIVTEIDPAAAERVEQSEHARLVAIDAVRVVAGIINRDTEGLPLGDRRARQALNLAVDRDRLVREAMFGRAKPLVGLTPPAAVPLLDRMVHPLSRPYAHDPGRAADLWREAAGAATRPLRLAAPEALERVAQQTATDLRDALGVEVEVLVLRGDEANKRMRRRLAEKTQPHDWDVLIWEQASQAADAPPIEQHRAFVAASGEYRAGPVLPEFEALYAKLQGETAKLQLARVSHEIDQFVYDEALALFLVSPQSLYAVNKHVDFTPYATTFELARTKVTEEHWSRR